MNTQVCQIHFEGRIALRLNQDLVRPVQGHVCNGFQIHRRCENTALLVICMVASDLRSAGGGKLIMFSSKKVDCPEKPLIYRHIRRISKSIYYQFTTFAERALICP